MLYIVNDTSISILEKANSGSQGGTSAFLAGFINYLLQSKIEFGVIGNFEIANRLVKKSYFINPSGNLEFLKYLIKIFSVTRFDDSDIFYFQRPDHLACSLFSKKIRILHLHGQPRTTIINNKNRFTKLSFLVLERLAMKSADLILVTDNRSAAVYVKQYPDISNKIKVIPTGIDLAFFSSIQGLATQDRSKLRKELVYIGRLAPPKQLFEMLKAFHILAEANPGYHFRIAGTGPLLSTLQQNVSEMGLEGQVSFLGVLSKIQIRELIRNSDAAILLSGNEGSPVSIKEVLACGKPVIVNDVGDLTEYIFQDKNGYIVHAENSGEVAAAIAKAFENSDKMRDECSSSMLPYEEYNINRSIANHIFEFNKPLIS